MPGILIFSEQDELALALAPKGVEIAQDLKMELSAAVLGPNGRTIATQYFTKGVARAYISENEFLAKFDAGVYSQAIFQIAEICQPEILLCVSTKRGREVAPQLARMLDAGCLTNVLDIQVKDGQLVTSRYGLGGATVVSEYLESPKKVIAVLPQRFETAPGKAIDGQCVSVELRLDRPIITIVERRERARESVDIEKSNVLICVGKGLKRKEDLELVQELAGVIKGEIGCTREISSNLGWLTEDRLVGMSGKRCKPKVVFSIGISGQNQYVAGIIGAKVSVAINSDANAPIFKAADYGIVDDLYRVLPELIEKLRQSRSHA